MRIETTGERETQFDVLRNDPELVAVLEAAASRATILKLLIELVRNFHTDQDYRSGVNGQRPSDLARVFARTRGAKNADKDAINRFVAMLGSLYRRHAGKEDHLRGFIVEMMVMQALRTRYGGARDILDDNVKFAIMHNNGAPAYESSRTVDVVGYEHTRELAEVHDCKLQASKWAKPSAVTWVRELEREAVSRGVRVGLVTTTARDRAQGTLDNAGIGQLCTLIPLERLWDLAPLQPA